MLLNTRQSPTHVDVCDLSMLHMRERDINVNEKKFISPKSPRPMSSRGLQFVVTNRIPSNIVLLPKQVSSSTTSLQTPLIQRQKADPKKYSKQTGIDVYRSLVQASSRCSISSEREISNDEMSILANSFVVDRISPLANTGLYRTNHLPKIHTNSNLNQKLKANYQPFPTTRSEIIESIKPQTSKVFHQTKSDIDRPESEKEKVPKPARIMSCRKQNHSRKQLHVYMPDVSSQ